METAEQAVRTAESRQRRVGTLTLGVVLVAAGTGMLASMFSYSPMATGPTPRARASTSRAHSIRFFIKSLL